MSSVRRPHGRLFQIRGPAAPKLLSPKLMCVRGTAHMLSEEDWRDRRLPSETRWISSARYVGILPHNAWRTRQVSLNSTRRQAGSQCSWHSTGVMWSRCLAPVMRHAPAFCSDWTLLMTFSVTPYRSELSQYWLPIPGDLLYWSLIG